MVAVATNLTTWGPLAGITMALQYARVLAFCAAVAAGLSVPASADSGTLTIGSHFGMSIGGAAVSAQDVMWAEGYGFEGAVSCADTGLNCQAGEQVFAFQPVELGKHGEVYLKIADGRVTGIAWSISPVAYCDG